VFPEPFVNGVSTAGSRKGLFKGGSRGVLHAFCGAGVDGESHPTLVRKAKRRALRTPIGPHPGSREAPEAG
jgi:hypothetical protein